MRSTFSYTLHDLEATLTNGRSVLVDVEVEGVFTFHRATGPTFDCGGQPAELDIDTRRATVTHLNAWDCDHDATLAREQIVGKQYLDICADAQADRLHDLIGERVMDRCC